MKKTSNSSNESSFGTSRRTFLKQTGFLAFSAASMQSLSTLVGQDSLGIVVHSYAFRWNGKSPSEKYPPFTNAIELLQHSKEIGAGGIQVVVNQWTSDFAKQFRAAKEKANLFAEASIALPKTEADIATFEANILSAKWAGMEVLRTVCLPTRRYETFHSLEDFKQFKKQSVQALQWAEPIVRKHQLKLAVENHKDWKAAELAQIIKDLNSPYIGVTLDFGNNLALLEEPMQVIRTLAPYVFSTHVKDMGLATYHKGFLLAEVPLGKGVVDLKEAVRLCRSYNPKVKFCLEMITRDPLEIPCKENTYWATFEHATPDPSPALKYVEAHAYAGKLPAVAGMDSEAKLAFEEKNIIDCLTYAKAHLNL